MNERKVWFKVARPAHGKHVVVSCSMQEDNLSVKWAVTTFNSSIKAGVVEAKAGANRALNELQEAVT